MKNFFTQKNKVSGFTLVETLIAISIFSISVVALMSFLSQNLADTEYVKEKMIAVYLAQENIEYVRNMRDTYVLYSGMTGNNWGTFKTKLATCNTINDCGFSNSLPSPGLAQKIQMTQINANEVKIISTVSWTGDGAPFSIILSENLFNWVE